jgi:type IV pilus assembly PilX-like protein
MTNFDIRGRQRGVALVIGMIMLVMLTLLVVSAINTSTTNLKIAGNMQSEDEARAMAQQAIEQFISSYANFYPVLVGPTTTGFDVNNDTNNDYSVTVARPVCKRAAQQIPPRSIDCANGAKNGIYCWDTLWEVAATAVDTKSGVSQSVVQGVSLTFAPDFNPASVGC